MSVKRYVANKDTTITNAFKLDLKTRAEQSNMGESDILEVFSIYGQATSASNERSRILVQFPIDEIISDRNQKLIGQSGSVQFILKLYNAAHLETTPKKFTLNIHPISASVSSFWDEGFGMDMETYIDLDAANWIDATRDNQWQNKGADYFSSSLFSYYFGNGTEDLQVDVTSIVEEWISGQKNNNGFIVKLPDETESLNSSTYTKKFFARGSEFFFKKPIIEARTDTSLKDKRGNFTLSSSLLSAQDNLNSLYIYNKINGVLKNIAAIGTGSAVVSLYSASYSNGQFYPAGVPLVLHNGSTTVTASYYTTGTYKADVAVKTDATYLVDVWYTTDGDELTRGVIFANKHDTSYNQETPEYILNISNLRYEYEASEKARFRVIPRDKKWSPNVWYVYTRENKIIPIEDLYYKIIRNSDNLEVVSYGTGSQNHTRLSYDKDGNYFDFDMNLLEPDYMYTVKFCYKYGEDFRELKETFKFRVK